MAAGLGFKNFTSGEVLTAADVNGYLNSQTVMVFADAAARTAAITSPQEGMISYLKDTNATQYYSGSAWVGVGAASPLTTKGDVYTYSTTDARIGVGANDTVLTADSSTATGLKWATPAAGGMTVIASGTLSGTEVSLTSISGTYTDLALYINNPFVNSGTTLCFRVNSVTTSTYASVIMKTDGTTLVRSAANTFMDSNANSMNMPESTSANSGFLYIRNYASTQNKDIQLGYAVSDTTYSGIGFAPVTAAITSIQIIGRNGTSTFSGGTYTLYGVK